MIEHLDLAERELEALSQQPVEPKHPGQNASSVAAYKARRKREVIAQLRQAIADRLSWHASEIRKAQQRGFAIASEHEPKRRSVANPRLPANA
jgi:hypothetical protein